jgi:tetratricopeptide (TPR) repeat protein
MPGIKTGYMRNEERSMHEWDYAIITNRYIHPERLKENRWPPGNAIHIVYADSIPLCAVLRRNSGDDVLGYRALKEGRSGDAVRFLEQALISDADDEMIFYNFACALYNEGHYEKADSVLKAGLNINPDFEPILMYLGNIAAYRNDTSSALEYYERLIDVNLKYFDAYVEAAKVVAADDAGRARNYLRTCLGINPEYIPAIEALADTYRDTDPGAAKKLDDIVSTFK